MINKKILLIALTIFLTSLPTRAVAHAELLSLNLNKNQFISPSGNVVLEFSEMVGVEKGDILLQDNKGSIISEYKVDKVSKKHILSYKNLKKGYYNLRYLVTSEDGHEISNSILLSYKIAFKEPKNSTAFDFKIYNESFKINLYNDKNEFYKLEFKNYQYKAILLNKKTGISYNLNSSNGDINFIAPNPGEYSLTIKFLKDKFTEEIITLKFNRVK